MHLHAAPVQRSSTRSAAEPGRPPARRAVQRAKTSKKTGSTMINPPTRLSWHDARSVRVQDSGTLNYFDDHVGYKGMADINPNDPISGHETNSSEQAGFYNFLSNLYPHASFIRGHLINGDMGGSNIVPNLFPITTQANGQHKSYVENHVKGWMMDATTRRIQYEVEAEPGTNVVQGARFHCLARRFTQWGKPPDKTINRSITSNPGNPALLAAWNKDVHYSDTDDQLDSYPHIQTVWAALGKSKWKHGVGLSAADRVSIEKQAKSAMGSKKAKPKGGAKKAGKAGKPKSRPRLFRGTSLPKKAKNLGHNYHRR